MPVSQETPSHPNATVPEHVGNPDNNQAPGVLNPSEVAPPTKVDTAPQQASSMPGDGSEVQAGKLPFKDQVIGYAKVTRGTVLRKPDVKDHGEKILDGQASIHEPPH